MRSGADWSSSDRPVSVRSSAGAVARLVSADQTASLTSGVTATFSCASNAAIHSAAQRPRRLSDAVEQALSFLRNYVGYKFGRQLMALSRIQADVLSRYKKAAPGDYSMFAAQADSLFMPAGLFALDEYGVPSEIARKIMINSGAIENVDQGLRILADIDLAQVKLEPFEREILESVQQSLPLRAFARPEGDKN